MRRRDLQQQNVKSAVALALALAVASLALPAVPALAAGTEIIASLAPAELTLGAPLSVSGHVLGAGLGIGGAQVALKADPYPFRGFATIARAVSAADGGFAFAGVKTDRDTRLRVVTEGSSAASSSMLEATVDPSVAINAASLGPGRTRLSVRIRHTVQVESGSVSAWWYAAASGTRVFLLAAITPTSELSPGLTYASATIDPPARRFVYRVCLNPSWEPAMGAPSSHGSCPRHDYTVPRDVG